MRIYCDITIRDAYKLLICLIVFELCLVAIYTAGVFLGHPTRLFDLDGEGNLPAWFSSAQLFLIGQTFFLKSGQTAPNNFSPRWFFILLGIGFIFLSLDETASIHETISRLIKHTGWLPHFKGGHGGWIFIYAVISIVFFAITRRGFASMWMHYKNATLMMASGIGISLFGGVLLEIVGYQFLSVSSMPLLYALEVAFEEFFEMFGASIVLYGALSMLLHESKVGY